MTVKETPVVNQAHLPQFYLPPCFYLYAPPPPTFTLWGCLRESNSRAARLCFGRSSSGCRWGSRAWRCLCDPFCSYRHVLLRRTFVPSPAVQRAVTCAEGTESARGTVVSSLELEYIFQKYAASLLSQKRRGEG